MDLSKGIQYMSDRAQIINLVLPVADLNSQLLYYVISYVSSLYTLSPEQCWGPE